MKYICSICGYVYDEAAEGTPFDALPADWKCPLCKAAKTEFKPEAAPVPETAPQAAVFGTTADAGTNAATDIMADGASEANLTKLSAGQLAALCSNLARGCEKMYKEEEAGLFRELAAYFTAITPAIPDADVEKLAAALQSDINGYESIRAQADALKDRGAARVCVWGEKVTRMLSSLVTRYLHDGESLLEGTDIWVCTACGYVYIGETPPELCPVCKVPDWKFEKIERRAKA